MAGSERPGSEVIFRQEHPPGRLGLSDFTEIVLKNSNCRSPWIDSLFLPICRRSCNDGDSDSSRQVFL